jgi:hypothetical protein
MVHEKCRNMQLHSLEKGRICYNHYPIIRKDLEGSGCSPSYVQYWISPEGTEEKHVESSVRIFGVPAEIRTQYLPDTNTQHYS